MTFQKVLQLDSLWSGEMISIVIHDKKVLIINIEGKIFAYEDKCVHKKFPLSRGKIVGNILTCQAHGWQYNVCTGQGVNPASVCLKAFEVQIHNGDILIDIERKNT